jgi:hypothetical protein
MADLPIRGFSKSAQLRAIIELIQILSMFEFERHCKAENRADENFWLDVVKEDAKNRTPLWR